MIYEVIPKIKKQQILYFEMELSTLQKRSKDFPTRKSFHEIDNFDSTTKKLDHRVSMPFTV